MLGAKHVFICVLEEKNVLPEDKTGKPLFCQLLKLLDAPILHPTYIC